MSALVDGIIFVLLFIGVGFCGISVIGLLLFPDIRSRSHTAVRASLMGSGAIVSAIILYSLFLFLTTGGNQYLVLFALVIVLFLVVLAGNVVITRIIMKRTSSGDMCRTLIPDNDDKSRK